MLNLTPEHIAQIRGYFIAESDEEKSSLQNEITPQFLKGFLTDLRRLFIYEPNNAEKLLSIGKSMGASEHIEALKEIQQQYYSDIAGMYLKGNNNEDIQQLLKANNQSFLSEVSFQKELQSTFILNEREQLKKKFQEMDKGDEINPAEIDDAFKHIERTRLKEYFKELDELDKGALMVAEPIMVYENKPIASEAVTAVYNFNWKRFAIAASIVGLIVTTALFVIIENDSTNDLSIAQPQNENPANIIDTIQLQKNHQERIMEALASNILKYDAEQLLVLKERSFGFSEKDEKITVKIYNIKENIYLLERLFTEEIKGRSGAGDGPISKSIKNQLDSIISLDNKYTFNGNFLSVYLMINKYRMKLYKLTDQYYLENNGIVYAISRTTIPKKFVRVNDKNILENIEKINY